MATVFSNDMVAHVWAQNCQSEGRSHNGQYYFSGRALYSYGSHFVAGYVMPDGATLITADSYSITTSRHVSRAHSAARGTVYRVPDLAGLVNSHGLYWLEKGDDDGAAKRAIVRHVEAQALNLSDDAAEYLLGQVKAARSWPKIKREAERARDKAKADARAREIAGRKGEAERMAALSDREFTAHVAAVESSEKWGQYDSGTWRGKEWRKGRPSECLATFATELHRMGVTARAHCGKRVQATLKARLATVRARVRDLKKWESHGDTLATFIRAKADARALYRERMGHGPLAREENKRLGRLVEYLASVRPGLISDKGRESLRLTLQNCRDLERMAAERMERERADREAWLAGGGTRGTWLAGGGTRWTRFSDAQGGAMLRAVDVERDAAGRIVGGTLQTSHGADVPLPHALKAFAFVRRVVATGAPWHANGHCIRVGHFRVDAIDTAGTMRAGCHTIHLGEMERLAGVLGVADVAPSDDALEPSRGAA